MGETTAEISEAEAAIYDRQIRLWGLDAQRRLRSSKVLIAGLGGLGSEVCKNIVLAGVKAVVLQDDKQVSAEDSCCQFLVDRDNVGKNRAECSQSRAQALNPMVEVKADTESLTKKTEEFFKEFDVVCITDQPLSVASVINNICHRNNIKFFCGDVHGFYGYSFTDLGTHSFAEEIKKLDNSNDKTVKKEPETVIVKKEIEFSPLESAIADFGSAASRICPSYYVLRVIMEFQETYARNPKSSQREDDSATLLKLRNHVLDNLGVRRNKLDDSFSTQVFAELSPVCAIVGGVVAQEIIKAVSCKDKPLDNFFFFNGTTSNGTVEHFGTR